MASVSSSLSGSIAIETPSPTSPTSYSRASENVCMWSQQSSDACDAPRSCYDCLNASPGDDVQCVITSAGLCSTMADYVWQEDYRLNSSDAGSHFFPSTNTSYCESSDPVCVACEASQFTTSASGKTEPSQFCIGSNGCVCVGFCESPLYTSLVSSRYCSTLSSSTTVNVMGISVADIIAIVIMCFTIPVVVYLWVVRRLRRRREAREEEYRTRPPAHGPLLPLAGWKKYRADVMAGQAAIVGTSDDAGATSTAVVQEEVRDGAPLMNLQVAPLSIEFEDPQHPLTAVTSTGRRRSSIDNTNVQRPRPSQPLTSSNEEEEEEEMDVRTTPYAPLEDRAVQSTEGETNEETISASNCSWKTTTSRDGECFLEPRTCRECLDEIPTTGETCVLTETGICLSVVEYEETLAHDGDTYYLSENATYCDSSSNSFSSGCVVVESCESSTWLSYARQRLPLVVLAVGGNTPEGCSFATDTDNAVTGGGSESAADASASLSAAASSTNTLASDDKCTWYQNTTLCSTPRTCYDCLNTLADSGDACTITPAGYCATLSTNYNYKLDFRRPGSSDGYFYPSTNATYCEADDQACTDCSIGGSSANSATYCVGSGGCVCVAFCQSAEWRATVMSEKCEASVSTSTPDLYGTEFPWKSFCIFLGLAVVASLAVLLGVWRVRQVIRARRRESMRATETRRSTLSLELPAWKALREELIDKKVDPVGEGRGRLRPM